MPLASIPSPSANGFHVGPLFFHFYGLCYVIGITAAVILTRRLWREQGGDPDLVYTVALWGVPAGIIGARLYHDVTSWNEVQHNWYGWLAIWQGGLGIWGGIAGGFLGGVIPLRRHHVSVTRFMDAAAPGYSSRRRSGGSATTSTRSCSAARRAYPGRCRSAPRTGRPDISATRPSTRRSCTS